MKLSSFIQRRRNSFATAIFRAVSLSLVCTSALADHSAAKLYTLDNALANQLITFQDMEKPVLIGGKAGEVIAIIYGKNKDASDALLNELFAPDVITGCSHGGPVTCCNAETNDVVLSVTSNSVLGWVKTGERCDVGLDAAEIELISVPELISSELKAQFGVDECLMGLADNSGKQRALVNATEPGSAGWTSCFDLNPEADDHYDAEFAPARCWSAKPAACRILYGDTMRCGVATRHWYTRFSGTGWCEWIVECSCPRG